MAVVESIKHFVEPILLTILLVYAYGFISRSQRADQSVDAIMGGIFGLAAVAAMSSPIPIAEGVIVDVRNLFIGIAAAFFGLLAAGIAIACAGLARLLIGGEGVLPALMGLAIAAGMGLAWARWVRPQLRRDLVAYMALGLMISAHVGAAAVLPADIRAIFLTKMAPALLVANILGAVLLGKLLMRERGLLDELGRLTRSSSTDALTGLTNRDAAVQAYNALPDSYESGRGIAMMCIDVDCFKQINDTHGHLAGDAALVAIAKRMSGCLRPEDIFARISGDEFLIVLHDLTAADAKAVAERCRAAVGQKPVIAGEVRVNLSVSIGCNWQAEKTGFQALRLVADETLYAAKSEGRNCVVFSIDSPAERAERKFRTAVA